MKTKKKDPLESLLVNTAPKTEGQQLAEHFSYFVDKIHSTTMRYLMEHVQKTIQHALKAGYNEGWTDRGFARQSDDLAKSKQDLSKITLRQLRKDFKLPDTN